MQQVPVTPLVKVERMVGRLAELEEQELAVTKPLELQLSCKELVGTGLIS